MRVSRTQVLLTKISQACQSIRDMKGARNKLAFHKTSNTLKRTTSCSSRRAHNNPHSGTGGGGVWDDNTKKSNSSTSSSLGGKHNPGTPTHRDPTLPVPDPALTSRSPSPSKGPHSPLPYDEEGSSPASRGVETDPGARRFDEYKATASCSWSLIQHLASGDLKNNSGGDSTSESRSPRTPSEFLLRRLGRDSGVHGEDTIRGIGGGGGEAEESLDTGGEGSFTQWVHCEFVVSFEAICPVITQQVCGEFF